MFIKFRKNGKDDKKEEKRESTLIKVKLFDREHEKDLEKEMNRFLKGIDERKLVDIKYNIAAIPEEDEEEQIYCFTAMIIYRS